MHEDARPVGDHKVKKLPQLHSAASVEGELGQTGDYVVGLGECVTRVDNQDEFESQKGKSKELSRK